MIVLLVSTPEHFPEVHVQCSNRTDIKIARSDAGCDQLRTASLRATPFDINFEGRSERRAVWTCHFERRSERRGVKKEPQSPKRKDKHEQKMQNALSIYKLKNLEHCPEMYKFKQDRH